jgi:hypothetical protein
MKKIALLLLLAASLTANSASGVNCCYRGPYFHGGPVGCCVSGWIAPALVGGVIGYELAKPNTVVIQQPVPLPPPPESYVYPPPANFHYVTAYDPTCNCYKSVLVPN